MLENTAYDEEFWITPQNQQQNQAADKELQKLAYLKPANAFNEFGSDTE